MGTSLSILKLRRSNISEEEKERLMLVNGGMLLEELLHSCDGKYNPFRFFSVEELANATNDYRDQSIKNGSYYMYRGFFNGRRLYVKTFYMYKDETEYAINEVVFASQVNNHKNILMLLGCCLETQAPMLVYEYAEKGALFHHIFTEYNNPEQLLPWDYRLKVAKEIADALAYLHTGLSMPIIHGNVKPSNIYLDGNYVAKLSDFSLSASIPSGEEYVKTNGGGTYGYAAPEYLATRQLTEKCDVYSFGSLLIEILSAERIMCLLMSRDPGKSEQLESILASYGACNFVKGVEEARNNPNPDFVASNQRATTSSGQWSGFGLEEGEPHLHEFIIEAAKTYMGPYIMLEDQWKLSMVWTLASKCHKETPEDRPTMKEVAQEIRRIIKFQCCNGTPCNNC